MSGLPEAESNDQSWMNPDAPKKLPVAPYSEFNPPPVTKPAPDRQAAMAQLWRGIALIILSILLLVLAFFVF